MKTKSILKLAFLCLVIGIIIVSVNDHDFTSLTILEPSDVKEGPFLVINVVDGDTLDLDTSERVRLSGINTPEKGQCYYQEAKDKLKELVLNESVFLERDISEEGKYGRLLRYVYVNDIHVNAFLVENGYAKVYDKYSEDTKKYDELKQVELIAINNKLGVWVCKDPTEGCAYVGSKNSDKYHLRTCSWSKKISYKNIICFKNIEEVKAENRTPCKVCHPD